MKNRRRRQASLRSDGRQSNLFPPPAFSPKFPNPATLLGRVLALLLEGRRITSLDFQELSKSWRLAGYISALVREFDWPITSVDVPHPEAPNRTISCYFLPAWALQKVRSAS